MTEIDEAIISRLRTDGTLTTAAPGGVFLNVAKQGAVRPYVIVAVQDAPHVPTFRGTAYETVFYAITAESEDDSGAGVKAAANRIRALLHDVKFSITNYTWLKCHIDRRIRAVTDDADRRLQIAGYVFEVWAQRTGG